MRTPTLKEIEQVAKRPDDLLTIKQNATVATAAKKMSDNNVGCLVVFDSHGKFVGVLTERDMLAKVLATNLSPDSVIVSDIMTPHPISCSINATITEAEQLMAEHKIRHVPVVEEGSPIGMVSSRDVIAYHLNNSRAMKAAAEQLAMLSTGLKSLDLDDVIELAIHQVPKSFDAELAVLCLANNHSSTPMVYRNACSVPKENLLKPDKIKQLSKDDAVICSKICPDCKKHNAQPPSLLIPLSIYNQSNSSAAGSTAIQGFLCMCRFNPSSTGSEEIRLYKASLLHEVLNTNLTTAVLYKNYKEARRDSEIDPLTGVGTRRLLEQILRTECERAIRYKRSFTIAIVDLDNFKQVNDTAGHAAGDKALQEFAKIMVDTVRTTDVVARYGGDEFVLLLPETKLNDAKIVLERIRKQVQTISIPNVPSITISSGLAELTTSPSTDTAETLLKRADAALYKAKRKGRNLVVTD